MTAGEDARAALVRELAEGLSVDSRRTPSTRVARGTRRPPTSRTTSSSRRSSTSGPPSSPRPAAEIVELVWVDPVDPGDVELAPLTRDLLDAATSSPR